jgi:hypothetical protein
MVRWHTWLTVSLAAAVWLFPAGRAEAARIRYHFTPADLCGDQLQPNGSTATATRSAWFGAVRDTSYRPVRPTHLVTYRHPYTGRTVTIPLTLPEGTPRVEHRWNQVIFNYGSYTVEAHFLPDGSVDVVYNSGPFRPF